MLNGETVLYASADSLKATVSDTVKPYADTVNDTVFSLMKQDSKITAAEISERLKISLSTVRRRIKKLNEVHRTASMLLLKSFNSPISPP